MKKNKELVLFHDQYNFNQVGTVHVLASEQAVYAICFDGELETVFKRIVKSYELIVIEQTSPLIQKTFLQLKEYFSKKRTQFNLPMKFIGTEFQKNVWKMLTKIPYGQTSTYKDIGLKLKIKNGYQAIGQANRTNPICLVVPCHRVIATSGRLSGYVGGTSLKSYLLSLESSNK